MMVDKKVAPKEDIHERRSAKVDEHAVDAAAMKERFDETEEVKLPEPVKDAPMASPPPPSAVVDPLPITASPVEVPVVPPARRLRILTTTASFEAGGAHYALRAGAIMVLPESVASALISQRMAEAV